MSLVCLNSYLYENLNAIVDDAEFCGFITAATFRLGILHRCLVELRPCLHRLNMEVELQSLFGLHVTWCAQPYSLAEAPQSPPPPAFGLDIRGRYWSAKIDDISLYPPAAVGGGGEGQPLLWRRGGHRPQPKQRSVTFPCVPYLSNASIRAVMQVCYRSFFFNRVHGIIIRKKYLLCYDRFLYVLWCKIHFYFLTAKKL